MTEEKLHKQICDYLHLQYPNVIFNTDMAGEKLGYGQAKKVKRLRSSNGFPDIVIYEPKIYGSGEIETTDGEKHRVTLFHFCGLMLEVKKETIYKQNGDLKKNDHIIEQSNLHSKMRAKGYFVNFVWSFEQAKGIIDNYLRL